MHSKEIASLPYVVVKKTDTDLAKLSRLRAAPKLEGLAEGGKDNQGNEYHYGEM